MTDKQLFEAFGGVKENYLSEMLDDEPQRALELRPVKRSPVKFTAIVTAACLAIAGIAAGTVFVAKHGGISALMRGNSGTQGESISENCSVSLENIVLDHDWLKDYPKDPPSNFFKDIFSDYSSPDELRSDLSRYMERDTSYDFTPVTADLKLSFSAWDKLPNEKVMAQVQFFADGELIKYIPFKDPYFYHPEYETKFKQDEFDPITLVYDVMGYFTLDKARADNASSDSEEKFYEFPVTFDVKKGTHQITAAVEFLSIEPGYSSSFESFSEVLTRTYLIDRAVEPPSKTYSFANDTAPGWFSTEKATSEDSTSLFTDNRTLMFNTNSVRSRDPFYLMVLMDGKPIECFDGKNSLMVDPKDTQNGFTYKIPEDFISSNNKTSTLWLLAIPIVNEDCNGVYAAPVTPRYFLTTKAKYVTELELDYNRTLYDDKNDTLFKFYTDKEVFTKGEPIRITARFENLSDKPLALRRYFTTDPTNTESVISPFIIEFKKPSNYNPSYEFNEEDRNEQDQIIEPGEAYYREAIIDTSALTEGGKYQITINYKFADHYEKVGAAIYIEINSGI